MFETFVAAAHPFTFEGAATLFQLPYQKVNSQEAWKGTIESFLASPQTALIEIQTARALNYAFHQKITRRAQIDFVTAGNPTSPALVFLHGFLGDKEDWSAMIALLKEDYFCIAIDLPGHGRSPLSPDLYAQIYTFIHSWELTSPTLIGYSMGGRIAQRLKEHHPDFWGILVLLSAHPGLATEEERKERLEADFKLSQQLEQEPFTDFLNAWYSQPLFASLKNNTALFTSVLERRLQSDPHALAQVLRTCSLGCTNPSVPTQALWLYGEEDWKYETLYRTLSTVHAIRNAGHAIHLENPNDCAHILNSFLENHHANARDKAKCRMDSSR